MTDILPQLRLSRLSAVTDAQEYVKRFRDRERFVALCRECPMFGRQYGCPPFDADPAGGCLSGGTFTTYLDVIEPVVSDGAESLPLSLAEPVMAHVRDMAEPELLRLERASGGRAFVGVGRCTRCGSLPCARLAGEPCRHPESVRPSLEAVGFDVEAIARELFGVRLMWSADGRMPARLHLVTALWRP